MGDNSNEKLLLKENATFYWIFRKILTNIGVVC